MIIYLEGGVGEWGGWNRVAPAPWRSESWQEGYQGRSVGRHCWSVKPLPGHGAEKCRKGRQLLTPVPEGTPAFWVSHTSVLAFSPSFSFSLLHFFDFPCVSFFFFLYIHLPAPGGGFMFQSCCASKHPIGNMISSISFLHTPLTLLASITFHVNQSLPTPFPI